MQRAEAVLQRIQHYTHTREMGAGLAALHNSGAAMAPNATPPPVMPFSSVETVAPCRVGAAGAAAETTTAAPTPLPPASQSTANPRQHLTEARTAAPPAEPPQRVLAAPEIASAPQDPRLHVLDDGHGADIAVLRLPNHPSQTVGSRRGGSNDGVEEGKEEVAEQEFARRARNDHESPDAETSPSPDAPEPETRGGESATQDAEHEPQPPVVSATKATAGAAGASCGDVHNGMVYRPIARSASPGQALGQYDGLPLTSVQQVLEAKHKVYRICLTGGPCAGKSTMLSAMQAKIPQRMGFRVMCVPEAATLLVTGGMQWNSNIVVAQQAALLRTQLALEDQFYALAVASGVPTIVVSDRGTMDGRAFCSDAQFQEILRSVGSTVDVLRDRYDAVLHMVTAANGAEEFYNLDNPARYEDLDGARASDLRLQEMYVGHPMFRLLDNSTTFEDKIERGLQVVGQVVHKEQCAPSTPSFYLVRRCPPELPVASASYTTYTTVLNNSQMNDIRLLVRREMADGSCMHFFKSVKDTAGVPASSSAYSTPRALSRASNGGASFRSSTIITGGAHGGLCATAPSQQRIESAQRISSREYGSLKQHRDRAREEVVMRATHFIYEGANYELTTLLAPSWAAGRQTLTVESCTPSLAAARKGTSLSALRLPPFLEVDREVPVESLTTAFLISHRETGALYTSLAFAPVFSRAVVTALGAHADTENILNSTLSIPRSPSMLRAPKEEKAGEEEAAPPVPSPVPAVPVRRGLASLDVNTVPTVSSTLSKSTPAKTVEAHPQPEVAPFFLGGSISVQQPRNVVTPSHFSLSAAEEAEPLAAVAALAAEHAQREQRVIARDPESILPPIEKRKQNTR